jgi:hypothetical protein
MDISHNEKVYPKLATRMGSQFAEARPHRLTYNLSPDSEPFMRRPKGKGETKQGRPLAVPQRSG